MSTALPIAPSLGRWPGRRSRRRNTTLRSSVGSHATGRRSGSTLPRSALWKRCGPKHPHNCVEAARTTTCARVLAELVLAHWGTMDLRLAPLRRTASGARSRKPSAKRVHRSPPKILARVLACCGRFFELLLPEGAERMQRLRDEQQAQSPAMEVDAGEAGLNAMRRALAEVEKKEVPPRAAPTDIGAPKGVAVKSSNTTTTTTAGRDRGGQAAVAKPPARTTPGVAYPNAGRRGR